jgi:hypothetical protein
MKTYLQRHLTNGHATSRNELKSALNYIWEHELTLENLNSTCGAGFYRRCQRVVENNGHNAESLRHYEQFGE